MKNNTQLKNFSIAELKAEIDRRAAEGQYQTCIEFVYEQINTECIDAIDRLLNLNFLKEDLIKKSIGAELENQVLQGLAYALLSHRMTEDKTFVKLYKKGYVEKSVVQGVLTEEQRNKLEEDIKNV